MRNIDIFLREKGIKPSYQRKRIYEYLYERRNHPTVNDIYSVLIHDIPTLSKATVYNTMNLFSEQGLVDIISIEGAEARFDLHPVKPHAHFKCDGCNAILDVDVEIPARILEQALGRATIETQSINFTGLCGNCSTQEKQVV